MNDKRKRKNNVSMFQNNSNVTEINMIKNPF